MNIKKFLTVLFFTTTTFTVLIQGNQNTPSSSTLATNEPTFDFDTKPVAGMYCELDPLCKGPTKYISGILHGVKCADNVGIDCVSCQLQSSEDRFTSPPHLQIGSCTNCKPRSVLVKGKCGLNCKCKREGRLFDEKCCIKCKKPCSEGECVQVDTENGDSYCI